MVISGGESDFFIPRREANILPSAARGFRFGEELGNGNGEEIGIIEIPLPDKKTLEPTKNVRDQLGLEEK